MAAAQAGGVGPRREAGSPEEEAPSGPGAAAGGSGNAGSGACPGERPARSVAGPPPGSSTGRGCRAVRSARAGPGVGGRGARRPQRKSGPQPHALRAVSARAWVPGPPPASPPRAQGGEVSGSFPAGPRGGRGGARTSAALRVRLPGGPRGWRWWCWWPGPEGPRSASEGQLPLSEGPRVPGLGLVGSSLVPIKMGC